jgi:SHAQKYF class myb-like DNA-binding protein
MKNKSHYGPSNLVVVSGTGGGVKRKRRNLDEMTDDSNHAVRLIKAKDNIIDNNNDANNGISSQVHAGQAEPQQQSTSTSTVVQVKQEEDGMVEEGTKPVVPAVSSTNCSGLTTMGISILGGSNGKEEDTNDNNKGTEEGKTSSSDNKASLTINIIKNHYDESAKGKTHKTIGDNNNNNNNNNDDETKLSSTIISTMLDDDVDPYDAIADIAANSHLRSATAIALPTTSHNTKTAKTETASGSVATSSAITASMSRSHQQQPTIVTASMSNHYVPPRLHRDGSLTSSSSSNIKYKHSRNFSGGSGGGDVNNNVTHTRNHQSSNNDDKNRQQQASIHMLQSVGLECGEDGILRLHQLDDDNDDCDDNNIAIKDENETTKKEASSATGDTTTTDASTMLLKQPQSSWTSDQHKAFVTAIFEIGMKNCSPSIIMENMRKQPRYITRERTKSHLQKYRQTKERSRNEFLKDYDAFFKSTEQAKIDLVTTQKKSSSSSPAPDQDQFNNIDIKNQQQNTTKEPIPKAVLTAALDGKKPSKLLGGRAAALLSYSVLNNFSTDYGPDQLQYKAAKLQEFPIMTEEEKRTSVGSSLLQVKSLLDNMTDALLKSRHGIKPLSRDTKGINDEDSVASSIMSCDDGYSDDDDDCGDVGMDDKDDKRSLAIAHSQSKDQDSIATATNRRRPPFSMGVGSSHPSLYQGGPATTYPATAYSAGGQIPAPAPSGFPLQPYSHAHAPQSFYGGGPPAAALAPGGAPPGYGPTSFHPSTMHYTQDPRLNLYQQPPAASYPVVPPQATYYPGVATTAGYPAYYDGTSGEYPPHAASAASVDPYSGQQLRSIGSSTGNNGHQQRQPVYGNDGQWHAGGRPYEMFDLADGSPNNNKSSGRRAEKRSKRRRDRSRHSEKPSLAIDAAVASSTRNKNCDFMDRVSKVPSPTKPSRRTSSSPIQSRKHKRTQSSSSMSSTSSSSINNDNPTGRFVGHSSISNRNTSSSNNPKRKRSRPQREKQYQSQQQQQQFDTPVTVNSSARGSRHESSETYTNSFGSPADPFSEGELSHFVASPYISSINAAAEDARNRQHNPNSQMWGGPTSFMDASFNDQQQLNQGGGFEQHQQQQLQLQQPDHTFHPDQQQQQHHRRYDGVDGQHVNDGYIQKAASFSPSPTGGGGTDSSERYFFGE